MSVLLTLARFPLTKAGQVVLGGIWVAAAMLAERTDYRTLAVMAPLGLLFMLTGWASLTNWGGVWDEIAAGERRRYEATGKHPLGPIFFVVGVVAAFGVP